ncbi:MAG: LCP family protein [Clostridia bacterium]|nr:LCP family protein [Clostridia bacterium]
MNKKKYFTSLIITVLVLVSIFAGLNAALSGGDLFDNLSHIMDKTTSDKMNVLVLGLDKEAKRADVIMVVGVDAERDKITVMSIPRDTRVEVSPGRFDKINHTMGYENPEETIINAVKNLTGMPIHYYCEVTFEGFRNFIDILGGVEFDVPVNMHYDDPAQDLSIHLDKGLQVLNGAQAEGVVRFRNTYARADLQRIEVQQDLLRAIFEQKLTAKYILKAPSIIKEMYESVKTNLSVSTALKYAKMLKRLDSESLNTFTLPNTPKMLYGISYVVPIESELKELILTEFGYPEEEAKALMEAEKAAKKQNKGGAIGPIDELN